MVVKVNFEQFLSYVQNLFTDHKIIYACIDNTQRYKTKQNKTKQWYKTLLISLFLGIIGVNNTTGLFITIFLLFVGGC